MPQSEAGWRIEPPVSVPIAQGARPPATTAAEPPDEPPGTRPRSQGLRTGPKAEFSLEEPIANSSMFVLPSTGAPASIRRRDSGGGVGRPVALEDPRPRRGRHALGAEDVLDGDRDASRAAARPRSPARVLVAVPPQVRVQLVPGGSLRPGLDRLVRREIARGHRLAAPATAVRSSMSASIRSACGEGTRNAPSAGSGACRQRHVAIEALVPARPRRSTFSSSTTWDVGATSSSSSSPIRSTCSRIPESSPAIRSTSSSDSRVAPAAPRGGPARDRSCAAIVGARAGRFRLTFSRGASRTRGPSGEKVQA